MKTRILALLIFLTLVFSAEAGINDGTIDTWKPGSNIDDWVNYFENLFVYLTDKCPCGEPPVMPKCLSMSIPFGRAVNYPGIPSGQIRLEREKPSASIFSPQSLAFDFCFDSYVVDVKNNPSQGISREVTIRRPNGQRIVYQFKTGESLAVPIGRDVMFTSKLRMIGADGNPVADNPIFYERLFQNGYKVRFAAGTMAKPSIITPQGQELAWDDPAIAVESIYRDDALRQIWSVADGLADFVVINDYKYEIRLYAPENAGSKNTQGLYVPQGAPHEVWTVENPSPSPFILQRTRITRTVAGTSYVYDCTYVEATNAWTITSGGGLRKSSIYFYGDYMTGPCQILEETRNAANNLAAKKVSGSDVFAWGPEIVNETIDPDGANLTTAYTYWTDSSQAGKYGKIKTLQKSDGSWRNYDYDSKGRVTLVSLSYLDAAFNSAAGSTKSVYCSYESLDGELIGDARDTVSENDGRPRTIETRILGKTVNRKYFAYRKVNGEAVEIEEEGLAEFGDSSNRRNTTVYYASSTGDASKGRIKSITWSDGKKDSYSYEYGTYSANPDPSSCSFTAGTGDALCQTVIHGTSANPSGIAGKSTKETVVTDGHGNNVMTETYAYDGAGYSRVVWNVKTFNARHHILASYDSNGTYSTAAWNCCLKDSESTNDGTQYTYSYNLLQQLVSKTKVGGPTTAYTYDVEGRQLSETISGGGVSLATSATYDLAGRVTSRTDAAGLITAYAYSNNGRTVTATLPGGFTEITDKYLDGKIKSVTGTAVIAKYYTYGAIQDGSQWIKVCTAVENGSNYVKTTTDTLGRTVSEEKPGATGTLVTTYFYNTQGLLIKTSSTGNADTLYAYDDFNNLLRTALDLNSNGQIDLSADDRVSESETSYQSVNSQWWSVTTSKVYNDSGNAVTSGITKKQLTDLSSGTISNTISTDINGNDTVSTTTLNRTNKTIVQTINTPDSNVDSVSTTVNGLLVSQRTKENLTYNYSYDGIGRKIGDTDPRTGASVTHYNTLGQVDYVQDAAGKQTSFTYEAVTGRKSSIINALNKSTIYTYNTRGQILTVRGDASYSLDYVYDSYGRMTQLKTYRNSNLQNPDITAWNYQDATGLLTSKTYADNKSVSYTYSVDGKLAERTWSRGVVTTYGYNVAGDLTGITYSDSTPAVAFTYNRLGQQVTVTDEVGSRTFGYNGVFQLTSEAIIGIYNKTLSCSYDTLGRSSVMNIGTEYAVGYGYDALGRFSTVTNGNDTFTYSCLASSNLISGISYPNNISVTKSYEANRDLVTSVVNKYGQTVVSEYDYTNDDIGRRTAMAKSGTAFSQSDSIAYGYNDRSEVTSAVAQNQTTYNYGFNYDPIGNRFTSSSTETGAAVTRTYASNQLNQYTAFDNPSTTPAYDNDGNMLNDGIWTFTWNGENRIITATQGTTVVNYKYDYFGRRIERKVTEGGTITSNVRYTYEPSSFNKIEELNALDSNAIARKYIWGLDITGSMTKTGSVGALLTQIDGTGTTYSTFDANGNVSEYLDASGTIQGHLEYSPFGKGTVETGARPDDFAFRFSTKYEDALTGDFDYGYRNYDSKLGRWRSRDPIGEKGGNNIYCFCLNNSANYYDLYGCVSTATWIECHGCCESLMFDPSDPQGWNYRNCMAACLGLGTY